MLALALLAGGCTTTGWIASSGPSRSEVTEPASQRLPGVQLVDIDDAVARQLLAAQRRQLFSEALPGGLPLRGGHRPVGPGDVLEISVYEAPPALLFGGPAPDVRGGLSAARSAVFPEQMVGFDGTITVPFAGTLNVAGSTPQQIEAEVTQRLRGKANQPQVVVRPLRVSSATVTVVGEVAASLRLPLTPGSERLLDALAAAGGVRQPVSKMSLQLTRGETVLALPLDTIIRDPRQNVVLQPGDVITALFQPLSFTVLGATGRNEEVNFEATGISLAQALARAGGLNDARADARGVFIFRLEEAQALNWKSPPPTTPDGRVPVVYRLDLQDASSFFAAQGFPIANRDVLYVANAPAAELQKFLNIVWGAALPALNIINLTR